MWLQLRASLPVWRIVSSMDAMVDRCVGSVLTPHVG